MNAQIVPVNTGVVQHTNALVKVRQDRKEQKNKMKTILPYQPETRRVGNKERKYQRLSECDLP